MSLKFYYFDGRGIGEPLRWIFAYEDIEFEDVRIPYNKFPPSLPEDIKAKGRWGQVPLVEFEGKSLTQSLAVMRYFAKKAGLVPEVDFHAALCDEYVDTVMDILQSIYTVFIKENTKISKEKLEEMKTSTKSRYIDIFEKIIKENDGIHLVGNSITWADVVLAYALDHLKILLGLDFFDEKESPSIKKLMATVVNSPKIKKWLEKRPLTKY